MRSGAHTAHAPSTTAVTCVLLHLARHAIQKVSTRYLQPIFRLACSPPRHVPSSSGLKQQRLNDHVHGCPSLHATGIIASLPGRRGRSSLVLSLTRASWQAVDWPSTGSRCRPTISTPATRYYLIYCYFPSPYDQAIEAVLAACSVSIVPRRFVCAAYSNPCTCKFFPVFPLHALLLSSVAVHKEPELRCSVVRRQPCTDC